VSEHDDGHGAADERAPAAPEPVDEAAFARPPGVDSAFVPAEQPAPYTPPPPTVSPEERAAYGPPAGAEAFAPAPGERLPPRHTAPPPVSRAIAQQFGPTEAARAGFDPAPGTRIAPSGPRPASPWWKPDAARDPWRDPDTPFWLGRGAVFARGRPEQIDPEQDEEQPDEGGPDEDGEDEPAAETAPLRGGRLGLRALLLGLVIALIAGGLGGGAGYWLASRTDLLHRHDVHLAKTDKPANRPPGSVAGIAKRVGPAVVSIAVTTRNEYDVGSGVVIDKHGYVLTNNHVVAAAASDRSASIVVTFSDEATAQGAIVGRDPISDLAVLKVPDDKLTVATLGDSAKLAVGDPVVAIGSPLGLQGTVTQGIVSALHRAVHVFADGGNSDAYLDAIQTDAAINPGNSGGALVDAAGAVVGINAAAALATSDPSGGQTPTSGIGYAIPINYARDIAQQLIESGKAMHASLGAQGRTATDGLRRGAYLEQIAPGGAAAKAGLHKGDVIVVADAQSIVSYDQLVVVIQGHKPGDVISVTYFRGAAKKTAKVTLGKA
jgi:S1-C subfamily serine protease